MKSDKIIHVCEFNIIQNLKKRWKEKKNTRSLYAIGNNVFNVIVDKCGTEIIRNKICGHFKNKQYALFRQKFMITTIKIDSKKRMPRIVCGATTFMLRRS